MNTKDNDIFADFDEYYKDTGTKWQNINDPKNPFGMVDTGDRAELKKILSGPLDSDATADFEDQHNADLMAQSNNSGFAIHSLSWRHLDEANKDKKDVCNNDKIRLICGVDACADNTTVRFALYYKTKKDGSSQFQDASGTLKDNSASVEIVLDLSKVKVDSYTVYFVVSVRGKYSNNVDIPIGKSPLLVKKCEGPASAEPGTKATYKVTELSRTATEDEKKNINWMVKVGDHKHKDNKGIGESFEFEVPATHAGDIISIHPYMNKPSDDIKVETKVGPFFKYDGSILTLFSKDHKKITSWPGTSGEEGITDPKQPKGPIPEGKWMVRQKEVQKLPAMGILDQAAENIAGGEWAGGEAAWGKERVQIYTFGADAHGRNKFYIHGGKKAGSKFGIDLTDKIDECLAEFFKIGKDLVLVVEKTKQYYAEVKDGVLFIHTPEHVETYKPNKYNFVQFPSTGRGIARGGSRDQYEIDGVTKDWGDNWADPKFAAILYNSIQEYLLSSKKYSNDIVLTYNDISAFKPDENILGHHTHLRGTDVDFRYIDKAGKGVNNYELADKERCKAFIAILKNNGFKHIFTHDACIEGTKHVAGHKDHIHAGF